MTIHKKSSRKPPAYRRKASGAHHKRSKRYHETYWPYIPLVFIMLVAVVGNIFINHRHAVLSYATDMSIQSLLDDTNAQRASNGGLTALGLNSQLNSAAQAKASDMAARDYWSHTTPDGQTPWTFMAAAGYNYRLAGENLAYGFTTAAATLTGWMNSPGHRANILNSGYTEVGFGYINIANYQTNGPETLVVAMYGAPQTVAAAPVVVPVPTAPVVKPVTTPVAVSGNSDTPAAAGAPVASPPATGIATAEPTPVPATADVAVPTETAKKATTESQPQQVARIQVLTAGNVSWSAAAVSLVGLAGLSLFLLRHGIAWHKIWIRGERYLLKHPLLDITLISLVSVAFILTRTVGHTR